MRTINKLILHCSDSFWGGAKEIRKWHIERGWSDIGYHYVICNGYLTSASLVGGYSRKMNGLIEGGRPIEKVGSHCRGDNQDSIGICLIGKSCFSRAQYKSLYDLINWLFWRLDKNVKIFGHCEMESGVVQKKTCPNINMNELRAELITKLCCCETVIPRFGLRR